MRGEADGGGLSAADSQRLVKINQLLEDDDLGATDRAALQCEALQLSRTRARVCTADAAAATAAFDSMPAVAIDEDGVFKYALVEVLEPLGGRSKLVVRGSLDANYHYQCAAPTEAVAAAAGLETEVRGGGRIAVDRAARTAEVYGFSYQYGAADHAATAALLREALADDFVVAWGDHGY